MEKILSGTVQKEDAGKTLQRFLRFRLGMTEKEISRAKFRENGICVNGERRKVNALLCAGDVVEVLLEEKGQASGQLLAFQGEISVLYEDSDVIVVDKPGGMVVHPAGKYYADTLANRLAAYLREKGEDSVIRILGRLDKDTSGVLLAVKNRGAGLRLERQREQGVFCKTYLAVTHGIPEPQNGCIRAAIGVDPERKGRMRIDDEGKRAVTWYETVKCAEGCALVRLRLETGRTHQIRVHLASIGCPILGDPLYGDGVELFGMRRTALHAERVEFGQPFTKERIVVVAGVPGDMLWIGGRSVPGQIPRRILEQHSGELTVNCD